MTFKQRSLTIENIKERYEDTADGQLAAAMTHDMLVMLYRGQQHWRLNFPAQLYVGDQRLREKLEELYNTAQQAAEGRLNDMPTGETWQDFLATVPSSSQGGQATSRSTDGAVKLLVVPLCMAKAAKAAETPKRQSKRARTATQR